MRPLVQNYTFYKQESMESGKTIDLVFPVLVWHRFFIMCVGCTRTGSTIGERIRFML
ncbi:conserved protein of unknown function [Limnospira indica PCC 8005]|uniref:Uncharacterized protein n=1 Tax=Limnospira indica PCC 8005 TaxID=376219 RepID=A0A9P1KL85_9CYAN|nr:conserved protein of unknown function [Limnospira indica PCC 8005]